LLACAFATGLVPFRVPISKPHTPKVSGELCTNGQLWQELHIPAGGQVGLPLSGRGDVLFLNCLSGFLWDLATGHPKLELQLHNLDSGESANITSYINTTSWSTNQVTFKSSAPGKWGLLMINHNLLWNADFTIAIDYFVTPAPPSCKVCAPGQTGTYCNESCSSNCFQCCQDNPSACVICAQGRTNLPSCEYQCVTGCLYCDNMAGCQVCADQTYSGPTCSVCRPPPCPEPNLAQCDNPCTGWFPFCSVCEAAMDKALPLAAILAEVFLSEAEASVGAAAAEAACLFLPPFVDVACEFIVVGFTVGVTKKYVLKWAGSEVAFKLLSKEFCINFHLCPHINNQTVVSQNTMAYIKKY